MNIAIIGAGNVGRALGHGWAKDHRVTFGVRDPASPKYSDLDPAMFGVTTIADAVKGADTIVLATPWGTPTRDAIAACGDLTGKALLDATNPLLPGLAGLDHPGGKSGGEQVAAWAQGAKVVKVFNTTGFNNMANPGYGDARSLMLYCGDDADAKHIAKRLAEDLGFDAIDFGPLANAGYSESFAMTWIWLAMKGGLGREFAFGLLRR